MRSAGGPEAVFSRAGHGSKPGVCFIYFSCLWQPGHREELLTMSWNRLQHLSVSVQNLLKADVQRQGPWQCRIRKLLPSVTARRYKQGVPESLNCSWLMHDQHLELKFSDMVMRLDYVWLRDHCRSASCYNPKTNQRSLDTAQVDLAIKPAKIRSDNDTIYITWPDNHMTKYALSWLAKYSFEGQKQMVQSRVLWDAAVYKEAQMPHVTYNSVMESDEELKKFLETFLLYGIAFIDEVPVSVEATESVALRIGLIRESIFGRMWDFTSDFSRGDTAYTKVALDRHIDTTYFQEPCGVQLFHCLRHDGTGGRTLLQDGFNAAENIRKENPHNFEVLTKVPIKHEYIENVGGCHNHMIGIGPVLNVYPWNNELYLIRYNNYDRTVISTVPHDVVRQWYVAHRALTTELRKPENEIWVKLKPGKVLFVDNWRVLHGRDAFTGYRRLCGCYLIRDDVLNTARFLGIKI